MTDAHLSGETYCIGLAVNEHGIYTHGTSTFSFRGGGNRQGGDAFTKCFQRLVFLAKFQHAPEVFL